ncbi:MAG: SDR family oxidoreductase [Deltaproteobacteria bacterium]|nr:SDR family oxidoreductase [Deltaproteobacteria bacterium]
MSTTTIANNVALITGANRGIGRAIAEALLERGAAKIYATARNLDSLKDLTQSYGDRVVAIELDVTKEEQVAAAAQQAQDVGLLINNAGVVVGGGLDEMDIVSAARQEMEVNYFATLRLVQQFSSTLKANGGGAIVNISSIAGLTNFPFYPTYSASKAAVHSLTQAGRALLASQGTVVYGVYPGPVDTDMARDIEMDKETPEAVAKAILDGLEAGVTDIFPDAFAEGFGQQFHLSPKASEEQLAAMLAAA